MDANTHTEPPSLWRFTPLVSLALLGLMLFLSHYDAASTHFQVALFLIPLLVVIGWGMGNEHMNLSFDVFQVAVLFVSVLLCNYLIGDGKSHWLEGMQLVCLYFIIAVCSWCKSAFRRRSPPFVASGTNEL